jgi:ubiquinone biosynthesis UbiH/UbiF/VisC/COQ6 family hydroxylase
MAQPMPLESDVLVVGAGPAGLALACALHDAGFGVRVLERQSATALACPADDGREIALTHRSRRLLTQWGLWAQLPAAAIAPLARASVRSAGGRSVLPFDAAAQGHEALGWLVGNHHLRAAAWAGAQARGIEVLAGRSVSGVVRQAGRIGVVGPQGLAANARLLVAADSRFSELRRWVGIGARHCDFGRSALLVPVAHSLPHDACAQECFLAGHTLALLPMNGQRSSVVWTVANAALPRLMALDDEALGAEIERASEQRLGRIYPLGPRHTYPLVAVMADRFADDRVALVGDAAVGMHPVTAHGYNLGLYGIEALVSRLRREDPGAAGPLQAYAQAHRQTAWPLYTATNALVGFFTDDRPPMLALRRAVIDLARRLPPLRAAIAHRLTDAG